MTPRQRDILQFIQAFVGSHRYSPSYREIQAHFGYASLGPIHRHIQALKKQKLIEGKGRRALTVKTQEVYSLPYVGDILPDKLDLFPRLRNLTLPTWMVTHPEETYLLRVRGDNWQDLQIENGDLLLVAPAAKPTAGVLILAAHHLMRYQLSDTPTQGVVVGVIRLKEFNTC